MSDSKDQAAADAMANAVNQDDIAWFQASNGHCGGCGAHGDECMCTEQEPCECRKLHVMGSGRLTPSERIEAGLNAYVIDGQDTLL